MIDARRLGRRRLRPGDTSAASGGTCLLRAGYCPGGGTAVNDAFTDGLMGRTPDCLAGVITAFAGAADVFAAQGARFADNARRFHARAREEDLLLRLCLVR